MKTSNTTLKTFLVTALLVSAVNISFAGTWTGAISTGWDAAGNWDDNQVPSSSLNTEAIIGGGIANVPIIGAGVNASAKNLKIGDGSGNAMLTIQNGGKLSVQNSGQYDGNVYINGYSGGSAALNIDGPNSILSLASSKVVYVSYSVGSSGSMSITNGGAIYGGAGRISGASNTNASVSVTGVGSMWVMDGDLDVGMNGNGRLDINDSGQVSTGSNSVVYIGKNGALDGTCSGVVNLTNGGTLSTSRVEGQQGTYGTSSSTINFNGGVLRASASTAAGQSFIANNVTTNFQGTAFIDTYGYAVTVNKTALGNAGAGGLTKQGKGSLVLVGSANYKGTTLVEQGNLYINGDNSAATGQVTVNPGTFLGGTGKIGGALRVMDTGTTLAPGSNGSGTLPNGISRLTVSNGKDVEMYKYSNLLISINSQANYSQLLLTGGAMFMDRVNLVVDAAGYVPTGLDRFTIIDGAGAVSGTFSQGNSININGQDFSIIYNQDSVVLQAVPEPSTYALLAGIGAVGLVFVRRRKAVR